MIITKLIGGLGNQMFQYAFGLALAKKLDTKLKLDITGYSNQEGMTPREFELGQFSIDEAFATEEEIEKLKYKKSRLPWVLRKLLKKPKLIKLDSYIEEKEQFSYDGQILNQVQNDIYLEGYWQTEKYFADIRELLLEKFTLKEIPENNLGLLEKIKNSNSVSLHIRRGDYVNDDMFPLCSLEYYQNAVNYLAERADNAEFFVFSDDTDWVKENLNINHPMTIVDINDKGYFDLNLMKHCQHNVIANSSFSWWGAWLNQNNNKIVVAPKNWMSNVEVKDLIPEGWVRF